MLSKWLFAVVVHRVGKGMHSPPNLIENHGTNTHALITTNYNVYWTSTAYTVTTGCTACWMFLRFICYIAVAVTVLSESVKFGPSLALSCPFISPTFTASEYALNS